MEQLGQQLGGTLTASIDQPVQFKENNTMVRLVLPDDTPGWRIHPDRNLQVLTVHK